VQRWGDSHNDNFGEAVAASPDGSKTFVTGSGGFEGYVTLAYDSVTGAQLWKKAYGSPSAVAYAIAVSPNSSTVFVTGTADNDLSPNYGKGVGTVAYDANTGKQLWANNYMVPGSFTDEGYKLAVSPDGSMLFAIGGAGFVGGNGGSVSTEFLTVAYHARTGRVAWVRSYSQAHLGDGATGVTVSPDGSEVLVVGESETTASEYGFTTLAYVAATGARLWLRHFNGPGDSHDIATGITISPDGATAYVSGVSRQPSGNEYLVTVGYAARTGTQQWLTRYNAPGCSLGGASIVVSPDGVRVYVTGMSVRAGTFIRDEVTIAYNAVNGAPIWARRYMGPNGQSEEGGIAITHDGSKLILGLTASGGPSVDKDYLTIAYDSNGTLAWTARYNRNATPTDDTSIAVAVSPDGSKAYVTGYSGEFGASQIATVAYNVG
jgi:hypothetical protein